MAFAGKKSAMREAAEAGAKKPSGKRGGSRLLSRIALTYVVRSCKRPRTGGRLMQRVRPARRWRWGWCWCCSTRCFGSSTSKTRRACLSKLLSSCWALLVLTCEPVLPQVYPKRVKEIM